MHKKSFAKFWNGKGFYVALAVVIVGSAIASYLAISTMMNSLGTPQSVPQSVTQEGNDVWNEPIAQVEQQQDTPVNSASSSAASSSASQPSASSAASQQSAEPATWQAAQSTSFAWPLKGELSAPFSGDELVFNATMQDWRTHNGIDLTADAGTEVAAPTGAEISAVKQDAQWGGTVELTAGELVIRLCGLENITAKVGDSVKAGTVLGKLGALPAEGAETPHLHMEMLKDGKYVDPLVYFA